MPKKSPQFDEIRNTIAFDEALQSCMKQASPTISSPRSRRIKRFRNP